MEVNHIAERGSRERLGKPKTSVCSKIGIAGLHGQCLYQLNHLTGPVCKFIFVNILMHICVCRDFNSFYFTIIITFLLFVFF